MKLASLLIVSNISTLTSAQTTVSLTESSSEIIFHTQAAGEESPPACTVSSVPTPTPSACSGDAGLTDLCRACNGKAIPSDANHESYIFCDSDFTNVTYNEIFFFAAPTLNDCIAACTGADDCYAPVIGPGGRCFQAQKGPNDEPLLSTQPGYAALLPRYTGSSPPPSGIVILPPKSRTISSHPAGSPGPTKQCNATDIVCPRCNNEEVKDANGTTYTVLCNNEIYAEHHISVQGQLAPEGCMEACDNLANCGGSTFWQNGKCELARGEDVFPQTRAGCTALLSIDPNFTPPPLMLSAFPPSPPRPVTTSTPPKIHGCINSIITCPVCDGLQLDKGLKDKYCVRCDLQPICKRVHGRYNVRSARACLKHCDAEDACEAAIYERGKCVTCDGTLESFTPYVLPHSYVVFLAEPAFMGLDVPIALDSGLTDS